MKNFYSKFCLSLFLFCGLLHASDISSSADETSIEADSFSYSADGLQVFAEGDVIIRRGKLTVNAAQIQYNQKTEDYLASGNVTVTMEGEGSWKTDTVSGNAKEQTANYGPFDIESGVWYGHGENGKGDKDTHILGKTRISTCDLSTPHYCLEASRVTWRSDKTFTAKNAILKIGRIPIFYLPYLSGRTDNDSAFFLKPGYSGKRGVYLRIGRIWRSENQGETKIYTDLMSKRGFGLGAEHELISAKRELDIVAYGVHDRKPPETRHGWNYRFKTKDNRGRLAAYARESLNDEFTLRMNIDWRSDANMLEDWFRSDYRRNPQPKSFLNLAYDNDWMNAQFYVRPRLNEFESVMQTLPELRIDIPKIEIADTGIYYESHNAAGYYSMKWRNYDMNRMRHLTQNFNNWLNNGWNLDDNDDYAAGRFDSLHTITRPFEFNRAFTLTPRASIRLTQYTRSSKRQIREEEIAEGIDADDFYRQSNTNRALFQYDQRGGSTLRVAGELGLEGKTRFYSDWSDCKNDLLSINGLRHIVTPYFNYTFAPEPSEDRDNLYFFDEIDRLEKQHFIRFGVNQIWQTHRQNATKTLATWETYVDRHFFRGDYSRRHLGDLGSRITLYPLDNLSIWNTYIYDLGEHKPLRCEVGMRYGKTDELNFSIRHIYRNKHMSRSTYSMGSRLDDFYGESGYIKKYFEHSSLLRATLNIPLTERTSFSAEWNYDFDRHHFVEHSYFITQERHCWTWGYGCGWDDGDFELLFMIRLNAFPNVDLDINI